MPDRSHFLSNHLKWYDGGQVPISCLLTSRHGKDRSQFPVCLLLTKWRTGPISRLLIKWQDTVVDCLIHYEEVHHMSHCLLVDRMTESFHLLSACQLTAWWTDPIFLFAFQLTRWRKDSFSCLLTSWQDGRKVPFPVCLPVGTMADRSHLLSAYQLTRWRICPITCVCLY